MAIQQKYNWRAGAAKVDVTPDSPIWMAGYGYRDRPSEGVRRPIHVRALALQPSGAPPVLLIAVELVGLSRGTIDQILCGISERHRIDDDRVTVNCSHTHSGPVTSGMLDLGFDLTVQQKQLINRYTEDIVAKVVEVVGLALEDLCPASVEFGQGLTGFAVNRRRDRPGCRHFPAPVDHDVPVLCVRRQSGSIHALVFGYACHTTVMGDYMISGDHAGYAQANLESVFPGATALFITGCGADMNPLPRRRIELLEAYGMVLACAVEDVVNGDTAMLASTLNVAKTSISLDLQEAPGIAAWEERMLHSSSFHRRACSYQRDQLLKGLELTKSCPYTIQTWRVGDELLWFFLSGEVVVDYSLRLKERFGWDSTWVSGYCDELLTYIPSRRVLEEGGYEGGDAMCLFGLPAPFSSNVETRILRAAQTLAESLRVS